jgi:hypothetical protein
MGEKNICEIGRMRFLEQNKRISSLFLLHGCCKGASMINSTHNIDRLRSSGDSHSSVSSIPHNQVILINCGCLEYLRYLFYLFGDKACVVCIFITLLDFHQHRMQSINIVNEVETCPTRFAFYWVSYANDERRCDFATLLRRCY